MNCTLSVDINASYQYQHVNAYLSPVYSLKVKVIDKIGDFEETRKKQFHGLETTF